MRARASQKRVLILTINLSSLSCSATQSLINLGTTCIDCCRQKIHSCTKRCSAREQCALVRRARQLHTQGCVCETHCMCSKHHALHDFMPKSCAVGCSVAHAIARQRRYHLPSSDGLGVAKEATIEQLRTTPKLTNRMLPILPRRLGRLRAGQLYKI
jgi:hypothetical protein